MIKKSKIAVVIPCYMVSNNINKVISKLPKFIDKIYLIDDACPENSVRNVKSKSKKITKIFRKKNGGVGAAVKDGYKFSVKDFNDVTVRIDGDGQMNPKLIKKFVQPIVNQQAEFTKGNRFKDLSFIKIMPFTRIIGNIFFSILGNIITGNFKIFDFLNGFTCISNNTLKKVLKKKLDDDYYFDTALVCNLSKLSIKILDIKMKAVYGNEKSNINIISTGFTIFYKNIFFFFR
tara:strand:+ start:1674 stop:2372 length:699 start_codon:yes stop_codon:yes gene_type:complete